jgi:teichuronic acid biosynthesis glycosyltransferase TuaH
MAAAIRVTAGNGESTSKPLIVWLAGVSRDAIPGTDRHMAAAMTEYAQVLWVDPPVSPAKQSLRDNLTGRSFKPSLSTVSDGVWRLTPKTLPGVSKPVIRAITPTLVQAQVRWALRQMEVRPTAVVATHLEAPLAGWGSGIVTVLYGTDDYVAGAELMGLSSRRQLSRELRVVRQADLVAAVSPALVSRWAELGATPRLLPNGCWPAGESRRNVPANLRDLRSPIVGLVGQLGDRIDLEILETIATAGYSLLIVGPVDPRWDSARFRTLTSAAHVHFVGAVPASAVPDYLSAMDVGITPYRDTAFNRASFPLKTLEYLGAGLPVVSTALPAADWLQAELARASDHKASHRALEIAATADEFIDAIARFVTDEEHPSDADFGNGLKTRADLCIALAATQSWPTRAGTLAEMIGLAGQQQSALKV